MENEQDLKRLRKLDKFYNETLKMIEISTENQNKDQATRCLDHLFAISKEIQEIEERQRGSTI